MFTKPQQLVFHDCDGNSDDLITSMVLRLAANVEVVGTVITNGLCYVKEAHRALRAIEHYVGMAEVEVGVWEGEMPNPFPDLWRQDSRLFNDLPALAQAQGAVRKPIKATTLLRRCLTQARSPVTLVCTGPMTVLAEVLAAKPQLASKVRQVVIMGGAVRVPGNVKNVDGADGTAEWNVFSDPYSFKTVLAHDVPIRLISLDVTCQLPVDQTLLEKLASQGQTSRASEVAAQLWSLQAGREIFLWDPTTAMSIIRPDLFRFEYVDIDVITDGASLGRLVQLPAGQGRTIELAVSVDTEQVLASLLGLLGTPVDRFPQPA
jgi:purine nucleosidase